jgi:hypothetical protein
MRKVGGWTTLPRGTGVYQSTTETRGVPNFFCGLCRKGSDFDFAFEILCASWLFILTALAKGNHDIKDRHSFVLD